MHIYILATHAKFSAFLYVCDHVEVYGQISLVSLGAEGAGLGNMGAFRALRTFRALRPLRAVSRWEGMKASLINLLYNSLKCIFNVQ